MPLLYHYCSNDSFLKIISTRIIRASTFTLSNDILEGRWIHKVVEKICDESHLEISFRQRLLEMLENMSSLLGAAGICLSEQGDLLSQWRAYADNGFGISIGFDELCFGVEGSKLPRLQKVEYDVANQKQTIAIDMKLIFELIKKGALVPPTLAGSWGTSADQEYKVNSSTLQTQVFLLFPHLYMFKNPAFSEEQEWRSVTIVVPPNNLFPGEPQGGVRLHKMEFRAMTDRIVPYTEFPLENTINIPAVREVILGPKNITPTGVIEAALLRHGWRNVRVSKSEASYR